VHGSVSAHSGNASLVRCRVRPYFLDHGLFAAIFAANNP
jgi:hypothetical protein